MKLDTCHFSHICAIYGDTLFQLDATHAKIPKTKYNPSYRMPFCHQSVFVKTALLKQYHFDTSFHICADNDFFTTIYRNGSQFFKADMIVSIYDAYGISSTPSLRYFIEEARIIGKYKPLAILPFILKYLFMRAKFRVKSILPKALRLQIQSRYNAKKHP